MARCSSRVWTRTRTIYCTSYCNHGHIVETGQPVGHECYVLPPEAIEAERAGDFELAGRIILAAKPLRVHRGVRT